MATPAATAVVQTRRIVDGSPAWKPQATFALVTTPSSASSSPSRQTPKPSPRSAFRSMLVIGSDGPPPQTAPVPIRPLRVTSAASSSSASPAVPSGRRGSTMYRDSALASHTAIAVDAGSSSPNSASTPRGSRSTRDRYASLLYQLGDGPSSAIG